jgi:hypothetical protein
MIESIADCEQFISECKGDWIVHVVPVWEDRHSVDNSPSIIFLRVISTGKTFYFAFDHPDSCPNIEFSIFTEICSQNKIHNIKWALDSKSFRQLVPLDNVRDANLCGAMKQNEILELREFETPTHSLVRRNSNRTGEINKMIPLMKHLEMFDNLCESIQKMTFRVKKLVQEGNEILLDTLGKVESNGIFVDREKFIEHFPNVNPNPDGFVFSQYNLYTSTGRPSNRFGGVNYAALNTTDGSRSAFISRHGNNGRIVVMDYTAFHPAIICMLTDYNLTDPNVYAYLARLYFQKKEVDDIDIAEAKRITFRQLYGGVEPQYAHIKYLANLKTFINDQWKFFEEYGYVETPIFKRRITNKHILDPSPTKVFNYILQAVEGEIAIPLLQKVLNYLEVGGKQTKAILYTYDAVIYDFHKHDGISTFKEISNIMSINGKLPMKTYIGNSYQSINQISL